MQGRDVVDMPWAEILEPASHKSRWHGVARSEAQALTAEETLGPMIICICLPCILGS